MMPRSSKPSSTSPGSTSRQRDRDNRPGQQNNQQQQGNNHQVDMSQAGSQQRASSSSRWRRVWNPRSRRSSPQPSQVQMNVTRTETGGLQGSLNQTQLEEALRRVNEPRPASTPAPASRPAEPPALRSVSAPAATPFRLPPSRRTNLGSRVVLGGSLRVSSASPPRRDFTSSASAYGLEDTPRWEEESRRPRAPRRGTTMWLDGHIQSNRPTLAPPPIAASSSRTRPRSTSRASARIQGPRQNRRFAPAPSAPASPTPSIETAQGQTASSASLSSPTATPAPTTLDATPLPPAQEEDQQSEASLNSPSRPATLPAPDTRSTSPWYLRGVNALVRRSEVSAAVIDRERLLRERGIIRATDGTATKPSVSSHGEGQGQETESDTGSTPTVPTSDTPSPTPWYGRGLNALVQRRPSVERRQVDEEDPWDDAVSISPSSSYHTAPSRPPSPASPTPPAHEEQDVSNEALLPDSPTLPAHEPSPNPNSPEASPSSTTSPIPIPPSPRLAPRDFTTQPEFSIALPPGLPIPEHHRAPSELERLNRPLILDHDPGTDFTLFEDPEEVEDAEEIPDFDDLLSVTPYQPGESGEGPSESRSGSRSRRRPPPPPPPRRRHHARRSSMSESQLLPNQEEEDLYQDPSQEDEVPDSPINNDAINANHAHNPLDHRARSRRRREAVGPEEETRVRLEFLKQNRSIESARGAEYVPPRSSYGMLVHRRRNYGDQRTWTGWIWGMGWMNP